MKPADIVRIGLALLLAGALLAAFLYRDELDIAALKDWIGHAGLLGPLVFMGIYALSTVLFLPGSVITLAGGALFGPVWGTFYNLTGATIGAALAFLVSRYLASDWVARKAGGRVGQLIHGVEAEGWRFVAFVRLVPLFPFNLLNYALGLTRIGFLSYLLATYLFMLPGAIAYTYLGYAGREAVAGGEGLMQKVLLALALLATVAFLPRLISRLRQRSMLGLEDFKKRLDKGIDLQVLDVRSAADFAGEQGHLHGALNIPLEELPNRIAELEPERPIAIISRTDQRSAKAAEFLIRKGFTGVQVVQGGMTGWNAAGWPLH